MKNKIFALMFVLLSVFSVLPQAQAQYSCSDAPRLEQILLSLRSTCGNPGVAFCRANGRIGNTVSEALNSCYDNTPFTRAQCEADLNCQGSIPFCRSGGRIGNNITEAVNNCYNNTPLTRAQCEADLTCQGGITFCKAGGRIGATINEAVNSCYDNTPMTRAQCEADLKCY